MDTVLIAEDDRIHLKRMLAVLGKHSDKFTVVCAADGQEAIEVLKAQPISVLVTDIQMPRVDGLVLLAYVSEHHPNLPCLVMTSYGTPQMKAKLPKDLLRFFHKPFDIEKLARAILEILRRSAEGDVLAGVSPESFLNIIELEHISCELEIESADGGPGKMIFKDGILYDAQSGELEGEAAARRLLSQKIRTFRFKVLSTPQVQRRVRLNSRDFYT